MLRRASSVLRCGTRPSSGSSAAMRRESSSSSSSSSTSDRSTTKPVSGSLGASPLSSSVPMSIPAEGSAAFLALLADKKRMSLPNFATGFAGCDRIVHNSARSSRPWEASCIELREVVRDKKEALYCQRKVDFAKLRRESGAKPDSGHCGGGKDGDVAGDSASGPGLEVVHYFETSTAMGLAGYQVVATQVLAGDLPGSCSNLSGVGFAVWTVPHSEYVRLMEAQQVLSDE